MDDDNQPSTSNSNAAIIAQAIEFMQKKENDRHMATGNQPSSHSASGSLEGWTNGEKYYLYVGLKNNGSKNVVEIQKNIPTKTVKEIEAAIAHYKADANKRAESARRNYRVRKTKSKPSVPLANWAKLLTDNFSYDELQTETASALRLIADLEDFPHPSKTEQVDFREIYHQIADATEGIPLPPQNRVTAQILNSCMLETALLSKQFTNLSIIENVVHSININENAMAVLPRPTKDCELSIVRHLASQRNYNPLGIPEDNLLPKSNEPLVHPM